VSHAPCFSCSCKACGIAVLAGCGSSGSSVAPQPLSQSPQSDSRQSASSGALSPKHASSGLTPPAPPTPLPKPVHLTKPLHRTDASSDSTVDECPGGCMIQGQTMNYGPVTFPGIDAGSTLTFSVTSPTNGITVSANPPSTTGPIKRPSLLTLQPLLQLVTRPLTSMEPYRIPTAPNTTAAPITCKRLRSTFSALSIISTALH